MSVKGVLEAGLIGKKSNAKKKSYFKSLLFNLTFVKQYTNDRITVSN